MTGDLLKKMKSGDFAEFTEAMQGAENACDLFAIAEADFDTLAETLKTEKEDVEKDAKKVKADKLALRENAQRYFKENNLKKIEGVQKKSLSYQPVKITRETVSVRQVKNGRAYENLDDLSKDQLFAIIEKLGGATRETHQTKEVIKKASVRLL